ncbi:uncharacterized protein [Primulina huaijiensis]|uniref:uncharacterized protein n=1 Tax=Primulina huaijiensis TaxID=1492673 RepID=UPI003CC73355
MWFIIVGTEFGRRQGRFSADFFARAQCSFVFYGQISSSTNHLRMMVVLRYGSQITYFSRITIRLSGSLLLNFRYRHATKAIHGSMLLQTSDSGIGRSSLKNIDGWIILTIP